MVCAEKHVPRICTTHERGACQPTDYKQNSRKMLYPHHFFKYPRTFTPPILRENMICDVPKHRHDGHRGLYTRIAQSRVTLEVLSGN